MTDHPGGDPSDVLSSVIGSGELSSPFVVAGDWHGDQGWATTVIRSANREGANVIIHVGDFALDWPGNKRGRYEDRLNRQLAALNIVLIVSGGNHDNWETLAKLPVGPEGLATVRSHIWVIPRGGRTQIRGLAVGALGGAFSIDREYRTEGKDWWSNEEPTPIEAESLMRGGRLDILICHDAPAGVPVVSEMALKSDLKSKAEKTRSLLSQVVDALAPAQVFCGHWHQRLTHNHVHPDGRVTRIDVLDKEYAREGNAVLVWLADQSLRVEPLSVRGN